MMMSDITRSYHISVPTGIREELLAHSNVKLPRFLPEDLTC